jgi:hypothetical protein
MFAVGAMLQFRECGNEIAQATKDEGGLGGVGGT